MAQRRDWKSLGCAALVGALVSFSAGVIVTRATTEPAPASQRLSRLGPPARTSRNIYSPNLLTDPYVLQQQQRVVETLERSCRDMGEHCQEARAARQRIDEITD